MGLLRYKAQAESPGCETPEFRSLEDLGSQRETEHDLIFHRGGQPLRQRKIKVEFRRLLAAAGIRSIRLYDLRHTAATLAVAAGVSVKVISDQLGHASISFTLERYSHVLPSIQDEAAAKVDACSWPEARFTSF
jgi:integrase